ncbi:MAG: DUF5011 domain-containing protein [Mollicutes bacterium]|nr:DUF5011 domain-containing protein [Mollicutes bacterium]
MKKRRRKFKKKVVILFYSLVVVLGLFIIFNFAIKFKLIGDKVINVTINEKYFENGYIAKIFNKKTNKVKIKNSVDVSQLGKYNVIYELNLGIYKKRIKRIVNVVDDKKPVIHLNGSNTVYLGLNEVYQEEGFTAIDNYDGDITDKVKVTNNIKNKIGKYEVVYEVEDKSKNKAKAVRYIEISDENLLTTSVDKFYLKGYFEEVILKPDEKEYDYFKDVIFLGDSNTTFMHLHGNYISSSQTWGRNNLNIIQINNSTFTTYYDKKSYTLKEALNKYKPKYLIVTTGINTAMHLKEEDVIRETEKLILNIKNNYKDVKLIFNATFPVYYGSVSDVHMPAINIYNYQVAKLCRKHKINFINFADLLKDEKGLANKKYYECTESTNCGFHLNDEGKTKYINYIKHLDLERIIK